MPTRSPSLVAPLLALLLGGLFACDLPEPAHPAGAPDVRVVHAVIAGRVDVLGASSAEPIVIVHTLEAALLVLPNAMRDRVADLAGHEVEIAGLVVIEAGEPAAVLVTDARAVPSFHGVAPIRPVAVRELAI
ncbi:MAG: hypothetical protein DCC71_01310 [Proteobacteria bacterium]|nr:MAG: hypothetical protein DCC71_01310 [Pseudomonadota bacterium]